MEFGTIMLWYYTVDRTSLFSYGKKVDHTHKLLSWELAGRTMHFDRQSTFWNGLFHHSQVLC